MPNRPTGTITFLFTDIDGSTQLWEQHAAWMQRAFARQEAVIRAAVAAHGGYAYKMVGDAFQVAFATAPEALAAALEAQAALHAEAWGEPGPLRVRMALHTGVTEEREDDYVGPVLNRVARLLSVGSGGQVLLTQATYELVRDALPGGAALHDLGEHRLKDLIRPEHIYQATLPGLAGDLGPLHSLDTFPHNLPVQVTSFVGREKEIGEVKRLLLAERFVTLTGPGGTGKTRLSLQLGAELLDLFPDGTWLVELVSLMDPALVPQTVAVTLGVRESSGRPLLSLLTSYLRGKDVLLILDNCEHLVDACARLTASLLQACPTLFVLASSREALGIAGESVYRVPSLSTPPTPDPRQAPTPESLSQYEAVRLFIERAETVQPGFRVTNENAPAIAHICHRLEGIPLAIELAAVRIKLLRVEQIAARLDDRFRLLTGGSRTALPRHQTLRALIDWSYDLLSGTERTLLQRLSVFAGGWTMEAAEAICAGEGLEDYEVLDILGQLINKSLVLPDSEVGDEAHYRLLETIRQYARERLLEVGGGDAVRQRHLAYFLALAERAEPVLRGADQVIWLDRLENEVDNVRVALEWSLNAGVEAGLRLAGALLWYWHIRGRKTEGIEWLERALAADSQQRGTGPLSPAHQLARGKALNAAGSLLVMHENPQRGLSLAEESLALHRGLGLAGRRGAAHALWNMAQGVAYLEDFERAGQLSEESLALYREVGDRFGMAQCQDNLGSYALIRGDYDEARKIWEEDLALRKAIQDKDGVAWTLTCLGNLEFWRGDFAQAKTLYRESVAVFRQVNNKWAVSVALSGMGAVVLAEGDFARAAELYEEALAFGREMGDQSTVAGRRYDLARVAWAQGDYARACRLYEETLAFVREIGHEGGIAGTLYDLGGVAWAQGNLDLAAQRYEESLAIARRMDTRATIGAALHGLGRVAAARGDVAAAQALLGEALNFMRAGANPWGQGFALQASAALAVATHDLERAATLLGASAAAYDHLRYLLAPLERDEHDRTHAAARAGLGEAAFEACYARGRAMSMQEAMAYALEGV